MFSTCLQENHASPQSLLEVWMCHVEVASVEPYFGVSLRACSRTRLQLCLGGVSGRKRQRDLSKY
eukprot:m.48566 g.48566  ORF g.48566 m.48566 type:complete len:65 (+) comp11049_c0_seq3:747-941(+)